MPGALKTEAIVLRGIRYGEADRILHLYTPERGRVSAIAKGVRRAEGRSCGRVPKVFSRERARVPAEAPARGRLRAASRLLRVLRGARAPRRLLRRRGRRRLRLLRGGL